LYVEEDFVVDGVDEVDEAEWVSFPGQPPLSIGTATATRTMRTQSPSTSTDQTPTASWL